MTTNRRGIKRAVTSLMALLAVGVLALMVAPTAQADVGVGEGGGGVGGASNSYWVAYSYLTPGTAFNQINANEMQRGTTFEGTIRNSGLTPPAGMGMDKFVQLCKDSRVIWVLRDSYQSIYKFTGYSYNTPMSTGFIMSPPVSDTFSVEKKAVKEHLDSFGSDRARKDIVIICSAAHAPTEVFKKRTRTAVQDMDMSHSGVLRHDYTEAPQANPFNKLSPQDAAETTEYERIYKSASRSTVDSIDKFEDLVTKLKDAKKLGDQAPSNRFLEKGNPNRTGLADGGVLNLATTSTTGTISAGYRNERTMTQYAVCDGDGANCDWQDVSAPSGYTLEGSNAAGSIVAEKGRDTTWTAATQSGWTVTKSEGDPVATDFYQVLAVKCNVQWFNDLRNAHPGTESAGTNINGLSYSNTDVINTAYRNLTSKPTANRTTNNTTLLGYRGDSANANEGNGVERSAYNVFYTRACPEGRWANEQVTVSGTAGWNQPYSYSSDITRQITQNGIDPIGANNLQDQAGVAENGLAKTNFANVRDALARNEGQKDKLYGAIDAAIREDRNFETPSIELNESNRAGLAEGGVLNVFERTNRASITSAQTDRYFRAMAQTRVQSWNGSAWVDGTWTNNVKDDRSQNLTAAQRLEVGSYPTAQSADGIATPGPSSTYPCGTSVPTAPAPCVGSNVTHPTITVTIPANSNEAAISAIYNGAAPSSGAGWYKKDTTYSNGQGLPTPETTGFWQILSVHCNPDELRDALAAYGRENVDYRVASQTRTDTGVTAVIYSMTRPAMPTANGAKLFGIASAPVYDASLQRTGELGFYDKECSLACTTAGTVATGASVVNGATANVSNTGNLEHVDELGGAVHGSTISNRFEMFRDNEARSITTNVAYPTVSGTVFAYDGHAPISTTVKLWHDPKVDVRSPLTLAEGAGGYPSTGGTPDTSAAGGQLTVTAAGGTGTGSAKSRTQLFTGTNVPATQKNFSLVDGAHPVDRYSGPYATQLAGAYNRFDVSATWASLQNRPVVMNVKWEYQPTTRTTVPRSVGFELNNGARVAGTSALDQKIDVRCYGTYGTSNASAPLYDAKTQTGTGVENTVDQNVLEIDRLGTSSANAHRMDTNLVIKFVRGVAE